MTGCKHCIVKEIYERREFKDEDGKVWGTANEFVGYNHLCDGGHQKEYDDWHERNKENTYEVYKKDFLPCYVPNEFTESTNKMIEIMGNILQRIDEVKAKENETRTNTEG